MVPNNILLMPSSMYNQSLLAADCNPRIRLIIGNFRVDTCQWDLIQTYSVIHSVKYIDPAFTIYRHRCRTCRRFVDSARP